MRFVLVLAGAVVALAMIGGSLTSRMADRIAAHAQFTPAHGSGTATESPYPQVGQYDVAVETPDGRHETSTEWLSIADTAAFEKFVTGNDGHCRDSHVSIGDGYFSARAACDAPDGDIHNIGSERTGRFTRTSLDLTTVTTLWGHEMRQTFSYRLRPGS